MNLSKYSIIHEGDNSIIYKGKHTDFEDDVIIKVLKSDYPTESQINRFENEFKFINNLNIKGVRPALKFEDNNGQKSLILKYFAGFSLKEIKKQSKFNFNDLTNFFKVAVALSQIIGEIHGKNIIHKDITSNNILINNDFNISLIDFGISSLYNIKTTEIQNTELLQGTIAYISPEQTGRMNRTVDYRTDLYSLGVVLYEILTGKLPFENEDVMELIHAHISKTPIPPHKIKKTIPKILSGVILKLLSKNAEDRYQSAFGLKHDLELIQNDMPYFEDTKKLLLGQNDFSGRLIIPERLYGRTKEIEILLDSFKRICKFSSELVIIDGFPGVGKTALAQEIYKPVIAQNGIYIEGKYEKCQKNIPYFALTQAFSGFANILLKGNEHSLVYWKNLIQSAVGDLGTVITDLIPDIELIIGEQPALPNLKGEEALNRFNYVWTNFIKAISKPNHPVVLFVDDMQWADYSSLELLKFLLSDSEIKHFLCIVTFRANEVHRLHQFQNFYKEIHEEDLNIINIRIQNLTCEDIGNILYDTLHTEDSIEINKLADLIYDKTQGNIFFTIQFLKTLYQEELLFYNFKVNKWKWNFQKIKQQNITDNVVELLAAKIRKLPKKTQEVLKIASCIGNAFDINITSNILKKSIKETKAVLETAIFEGIILPIGIHNYKFTHNRIQQAVYDFIGDEVSAYHLQIGKLFYLDENSQNRERMIFDVVNQLNKGIEISTFDNFTTSVITKVILAELNYTAAIKAKKSAAYVAAFQYLKKAQKSLSAESWEKNFYLSLHVHEELSEIAYLNGDFKTTNDIVNIIEANVDDILHKIKAYCSLIDSYRAQAKYQDVIKIGLKVLSQLGMKLPNNPKDIHIILNFIKTERVLSQKGNERLVNLSFTRNTNKQSIIKIVEAIISSVIIYKPELLPVIVFKSVQMSIKHGYSSGSIVLLAAYGMILSVMGKIEKAQKFAKLAIILQEKHQLKSLRHRINFLNYSFINNWKTSIHDITSKIYNNYKLCLEAGDYEFATYSLMLHSNLLFFSSTNIIQLKKKAVTQLNKIETFNQKALIKLFSSVLQLYENLTIECKEPYVFTGGYYNEEEEISILKNEGDRSALARLNFSKLFVKYLFNKFDLYYETIIELEKYSESFRGEYYSALSNFYISLCLLDKNYLDQAKGKKFRYSTKKEVLKKVRKNQKQLKKWADHCPENFLHKYYLVKAEMMRFLKKFDLARRYYDKAISLANKHEFIQEEALCWELTALFYAEQENYPLTKTYFQNSYTCFRKWGAVTKLKQLEKDYPEYVIKKQTFGTEEFRTIQTSKTTPTISAGASFDFNSVIKAGQSLSKEVKLDNLLKRMLMIIMENAGAEYAVIIISNENSYTIEGKSRLNPDKLEVLQSENILDTESIPLNIVNYVIRTRKSIVVDNAFKDKSYSDDIYIQAHNVKSVFCHPIIHKNKLVAVVYLENSLSSYVFTEKRIETVNLLSSQMAVSIENALLYENLESKVNQRTSQLQEANEKMEIAHRHITDSINYASRIQKAVLPVSGTIKKHFSEHFVLYKPKEIVSGDFYWIKKIKKYIVVAVADCTGHGVPGAFVSLLGISFLNEIVGKESLVTASGILDKLRRKIKTSLHQKGEAHEQKEGMDIALCVINTETSILQYAGAYNPLYIIRNSIFADDDVLSKNSKVKIHKPLPIHIKIKDIERSDNIQSRIIELCPNRQPIGIYKKEKPFNNHKIQLHNNDVLYLFSDGFTDQFHGKTEEKFKPKRFRELLYYISNQPFEKQKEILELTFNRWKEGIVQIDDVLVLGLKIDCLTL